jgi:hypothetical protein
MYRGGAAKVLKYDDKNKMYAIKYLDKEGEVEGNFVMARKDDFEYGFSNFNPKMADGGDLEESNEFKKEMIKNNPWVRKLQTITRKCTTSKLTEQNLEDVYNAYDKTCAFTGQPVTIDSASFVAKNKDDKISKTNIVLVFKGIVYRLHKNEFIWPDEALQRIQQAMERLLVV